MELSVLLNRVECILLHCGGNALDLSVAFHFGGQSCDTAKSTMLLLLLDTEHSFADD